MGMYDELVFKAKLPEPGFEDNIFQTKDTPAQQCDRYEVRKDGTLWHESYDFIPRQAIQKGLRDLVGSTTRFNKQWNKVEMTGEIFFYDFIDNDKLKGWIEFSANFVEGNMESVNLVEIKELCP